MPYGIPITYLKNENPKKNISIISYFAICLYVGYMYGNRNYTSFAKKKRVIRSRN